VTRLLVLLALSPPIRERYARELREAFPEIEVVLVESIEKGLPEMKRADILFTFGAHIARVDLFVDAPRLKWVQALGTGVDGITDKPSLRPDVIVTNIHGIHGPAMAEAAISAMLALARDLPLYVHHQDRREWVREPVSLLDGKTAGILGVGISGESLAPRLKALGMKVVGLSATPREVPGFDEIRPRSALAASVGGFDYLVVLAPYTPSTHNLVDAGILAAMKPKSFLVNLARGGLVDEAALIAALQQGPLAGAALDVFAAEPLPKDSPLWSLPNVLVTPHLGGFYDDYPDRALPILKENLRRFLAGDTATMIDRVKR
jgi:D-2-hydroxyacid dehydrogenase (NADP+)